GTVELEFAYDKMKAAFSPFLSDTFNQYLQIRANGIVFSENYFAGSWDHMGQKLIALEHFLKQHQGFPFANGLKGDYNRYLQWYLFGLQSKKTTKDGSNVVKNEVRESFQTLIHDYPETQTARIVQKYYDQLEQNNFEKIYEKSFNMPDLPEYLVDTKKASQ
ncbi:MAG TPA: hypothetical protein VF149_01060, partial [Bacillales bacterium]